MLPSDWRAQVADTGLWEHRFGPPDSPVIFASLDPRTLDVTKALRDLMSGQSLRIFVVGPIGSGKSQLLAALIADAQERGIPMTDVSPGSDVRALPRNLNQGKISLLAIDKLDQLSSGIRSAVIENRGLCTVGLFATAETLSAVTLASLVEDNDLYMVMPPLEEREADVLVIAQLLWPSVCGAESDLLGNCSDDAAENLCRGPYFEGATSLRLALEQLADALIASGDLLDGEFRRNVVAQDMIQAVLASVRAQGSRPPVTAVPAVVVVEGSTDSRFLVRAAQLAESERGWQLLDGCRILPSGEGRSGGARAVWQKLIELVAGSIDCVGLFDNDDVGRREAAAGKALGLPVELLPAQFDRLALVPEQRTVEIEDLLSIDLLDRFYNQHRDLEPEEIRWRSGGRWRIVPRGLDKEQLANWAMEEMQLKECLRLLYLLSFLRKRLGLPIPHSDLGAWLSDLLAESSAIPANVLTRASGLHVGNEDFQAGDEVSWRDLSAALGGLFSSRRRLLSLHAVKRWLSSATRR
jgi:hypothetical protein